MMKRRKRRKTLKLPRRDQLLRLLQSHRLHPFVLKVPRVTATDVLKTLVIISQKKMKLTPKEDDDEDDE